MKPEQVTECFLLCKRYFPKAPGSLYLSLAYGDSLKYWYVARTDHIIGILTSVFNRDSNKIRIDYIWVHPEFRRRGVGKELLSSCIQEAEKNKIDRIELHVSVENEPALLLYGSFGFRLDRILENYYGNNISGKILYLLINNNSNTIIPFSSSGVR